MTTATLLLPEKRRLPGTLGDTAVARALARADGHTADAGEVAQLQRHFSLTPAHWPVAALTRQLDAGDAAGATWVRADPAYVVPDMQGARLMGYGEALGPTADDLAVLLPILKPMFGDAGFLLDAPRHRVGICACRRMRNCRTSRRLMSPLATTCSSTCRPATAGAVGGPC